MKTTSPAWSFWTIVSWQITFIITLMIFASEFDSTEWKAIGTALPLGGIATIAIQYWQHRKKDPEE